MGFYQLPLVHYLNLLLALPLILDTGVIVSFLQALTHFVLTMPSSKCIPWAHWDAQGNTTRFIHAQPRNREELTFQEATLNKWGVVATG